MYYAPISTQAILATQQQSNHPHSTSLRSAGRASTDYIRNSDRYKQFSRSYLSSYQVLTSRYSPTQMLLLPYIVKFMTLTPS
eukprot:scaffold42111_cov361-Skeletonema_dohrnii-CCMP3373.AAC.1